MTIPDDTIRRAAEAMYLRNPFEGISFSDLGEDEVIAWMDDVGVALPILRAAIRAELVQEMIADAGDAETSVYGAPFSGPLSLADWLASYLYLPESEDQP